LAHTQEAAGTTTIGTTRRTIRTEDPATGGEGGDCSGFTFKVWRESLDQSDSGFHSGECSGTSTARTPPPRSRRCRRPNVTVSKSVLSKMDALASDGHIGLIYATNPDGTDQIIEAKGEDYGTNIWTRTYRGSSSYTRRQEDGLERVTWRPLAGAVSHLFY
jgi:hypothetical protein